MASYHFNNILLWHPGSQCFSSPQKHYSSANVTHERISYAQTQSKAWEKLQKNSSSCTEFQTIIWAVLQKSHAEVLLWLPMVSLAANSPTDLTGRRTVSWRFPRKLNKNFSKIFKEAYSLLHLITIFFFFILKLWWSTDVLKNTVATSKKAGGRIWNMWDSLPRKTNKQTTADKTVSSLLHIERDFQNLQTPTFSFQGKS